MRSVRIRAASSARGDRREMYFVSRIGWFMTRASGFFQLWCDDTAVRLRALLARLDSVLANWSTVDSTGVRDRIARVAGHLELGDLALTDLGDQAAVNGWHNLATQLEPVSGGCPPEFRLSLRSLPTLVTSRLRCRSGL